MSELSFYWPSFYVISTWSLAGSLCDCSIIHFRDCFRSLWIEVKWLIDRTSNGFSNHFGPDEPQNIPFFSSLMFDRSIFSQPLTSDSFCNFSQSIFWLEIQVQWDLKRKREKWSNRNVEFDYSLETNANAFLMIHSYVHHARSHHFPRITTGRFVERWQLKAASFECSWRRFSPTKRKRWG